MIKLESVHIEETRGIRKLDLNFGKEKFAISGPNGTGKRGVIDAIEFALTGQIGRLTGRGTRGFPCPSRGRMWTRQNSRMHRLLRCGFL